MSYGAQQLCLEKELEPIQVGTRVSQNEQDVEMQNLNPDSISP